MRLICLLGRAALDAWWPRLVRFAEQLEERFPDEWPVHEIRRQADAGTILLWTAIDERDVPYGLFATDILKKPSGRTVLTVRFLAGHDHERWFPLLPQLEDHARLYGATRIQIDPGSRGGWQRWLPDWRAAPTLRLWKDLQ